MTGGTMTGAQLALWILLAVALVVSVVTDLRSRKILDVVTWPTVVLGLGLRWTALGPGDFNSGFLGGVLGAALVALPFGILALWGERMGWGDVKLGAAVGACLGPELGLSALVFISLVGAAQALLLLLWQRALLETVTGVVQRAAQRLKLLPADASSGPRRHIPYGIAIAVGTFWAMWWDRSRT